MSFHSMLEYRLKSSGVETPNHHLLGGVMINTMAILTTQGSHARLGYSLVRHILAVSEEIMTLCLLSDIDVNFRFDSILEVPLNILVDGNIIGFDIPALYFKRKPVAADQLHQAHVLFNFLALVRLFILQFGNESVSELVQDFNRANRARHTADHMIRTTGTGPRKPTIPKSPLVLAEYDVNAPRSANHLPIGKDRLGEGSLRKVLNSSSSRDPTKRRVRLLCDENTSSIVLPTGECA